LPFFIGFNTVMTDSKRQNFLSQEKLTKMQNKKKKNKTKNKAPQKSAMLWEDIDF